MLRADRLPVQDHLSSCIFDLNPPGRVLGFLTAAAIHSLDGAIRVLPPLELGRVDFFLPIAEHDGFVSIPGRGETCVQVPCAKASAASVEASGGEGAQEPSFQISVGEGAEGYGQGQERCPVGSGHQWKLGVGERGQVGRARRQGVKSAASAHLKVEGCAGSWI